MKLYLVSPAWTCLTRVLARSLLWRFKSRNIGSLHLCGCLRTSSFGVLNHKWLWEDEEESCASTMARRARVSEAKILHLVQPHEGVFGNKLILFHFFLCSCGSKKHQLLISWCLALRHEQLIWFKPTKWLLHYVDWKALRCSSFLTFWQLNKGTALGIKAVKKQSKAAGNNWKKRRLEFSRKSKNWVKPSSFSRAGCSQTLTSLRPRWMSSLCQQVESLI